MERRNNYELAARQAETLFLNYDQEAVINSFGLNANMDYIYLDFVAKPYRIVRATGALERGPVWTRAGFEEVLSVYDALCHSGKPPVLTGEWLLTGSLRGAAAGPSALESPERVAWLAENHEHIPTACRALGGIEGSGGDVAFVIPVFGSFSTLVRLWLPDDEFPAQLQFLWDKNALAFVHYETIFYMMGHILDRLEEEVTLTKENRQGCLQH